MEEQDTEPLVFADQFVDPDPTKALTPEELLRRARMILATELGKDPILRQEMRNRFKAEALISVRPTERGIAKIDEFHPFFVRLLQHGGYSDLRVFGTEFQIPGEQASFQHARITTVPTYSSC